MKTHPTHQKKSERGRRAHEKGKHAERLCRWYLRFKGYRIVAANWRCRHGEIDIIARRRGVLAFIEIKARPDMMQAGQAVMARSRRRVSMAAAVFLASQPNLSRKTTRFDVMMVLPGRLPIHHADAWRID